MELTVKLQRGQLTEEQSEKCQIIIGGKSGEPETWDEYVEDYKDEYKPHVLALKKLIEDSGLVGSTGEDGDNWAFVFSDGEVWSFTWRGWGDFMQALVNKKEGYMAYYM